MYGRMTWYKGSPDKVETGIATVKGLLPTIQRFPGYSGFALFVELSTGKSASLAFYKDRLSLKGSGIAAAAVRRTGSDQIGGAVTAVDEYELDLVELPQGIKAGTWARVISGTGQPAKGDEVLATIQATVVPMLKTHKGFRGSVAGMDAHSGRGIMVTIFDSRENLEASDVAIAGLRQQLQAFAEMADMAVDTFELAVAELPTSVSVAW
jgi:hypothetical protein